MHRTAITVLTALLLAWLVAAPHAQTPLTIAAASDLQSVLPGIAQRFEKDTGIPTRLTFGSSGNFFSQIQNGAPFDLFFSADLDYPQQLLTGGQAVRGSLYEYAVGRIVLWTRKADAIDLRRGLAVLTDSRVRKISIANPAHAPYGRAAVAALRHENLYAAVESKLVLGENISQAAQFVQSGNADVGIIALSVAMAPALKAAGVYQEIPDSFYPPIRQGAVVVSRSRNQQSAARFLGYLQQPATLKLLADFGFGIRRD